MSDGGISRRAALGHIAGLGLLAGQTQSTSRTIRNSHPRLLLLDNDLPRLQFLIRDIAQVKKIYTDLQRDGDKIVASPVLDYRAPGPRFASRRAVDRMYLLCLLYRLEHRTVYLDHALRELLAIAALRDWTGGHFTDTAELTHAVAIGYDWLWPELKENERALLRDAIVTKGLTPALSLYERRIGWVAQPGDANVICNSGIGMGALAVAESEPAKSNQVLDFALQSIQRGIAAFAPDGGWDEGAAYWHIVSQSVAVFLASLETAAGNDAGLSAIHGLDRAGRFRVYFTGPTGKSFNFADAREDAGIAPEMFWMARRYSQPVYAWNEQRSIERDQRSDPLDLIWYVREAHPPQQPGWPLDAVFNGVQCAFLRSAWDDPNAIFLAVKAGDNKSFHAHLDLGSFVLDALGVRWALDLGPDNYDLPGYFGRQRTGYFRVQTEAHNTLLVNGEGQDAKAEARITHHEFGPDLSWVSIDLSKAYPSKLKLLRRRIGLAQRQAVLIEDRLRSDTPAELAWQIVTDADIALDGQTAVLSRDVARLTVEIKTPRHALFEVLPTQPAAPQSQNRGTRKLVVRLGEKTPEVDLNIVITPSRAGQPAPKITASFPPEP